MVGGTPVTIARSLPLNMSLIAVAISLGACAMVPNPLHLLDSQMAVEPPPKPDELSAPVSPAAAAMTDYKQQIEDLDTDNLNLKKQLADALNENAKLKRQLNDVMQDNSLLRDLAARKMR